jgi:pyruvate kinase
MPSLSEHNPLSAALNGGPSIDGAQRSTLEPVQRERFVL